MPPPAHANFAATVVVSEALVNECLGTYLATYADGVHRTISWTAPVTVNGMSLTFRATADVAVLSVRAMLRSQTAHPKPPQGLSVMRKLYDDPP